MFMKRNFEPVLPLNEDLEKAVLHACMAGKLDLKTVRKDELSKLGKSIYQALKGIGAMKSVKAKTLYLAATELHHADPDECKAYLKEIDKAEMPEIQSILQTLTRKRVINTLVHEATQQISSGDYSVLALKSVLDTHTHFKSKLTPVWDEMGDATTPVQGWPIPCLPRLAQAVGGLYGVWVVGGEPASGKSTLALQVRLQG